MQDRRCAKPRGRRSVEVEKPKMYSHINAQMSMETRASAHWITSSQ